MKPENILSRASALLLERMRGGVRIGDFNALCLHAAIKTADERREVLLCYYFGNGERLLEVEEVASGSADAVKYSSQMICRRAILLGAQSVALVHNHPNGNMEPSAADRAAANSLNQVLAVVGVLAIGHFVVTPEGATNVLTGDTCTFVTKAAGDTPRCPHCGLQQQAA